MSEQVPAEQVPAEQVPVGIIPGRRCFFAKPDSPKIHHCFGDVVCKYE
jgi:hypothetical protein